MSALDPDNPEHNKPLELYPNGFVPTCSFLEDCLRLAAPADVFKGMLLDVPVTNIIIKTQSVFRMYNQCEEVVVV
jgi:hypothetical protein